MTAQPSRPLPRDARLRTQVLLDEADQHWFTRHLDETSRIRMYFLGERVEADIQRARYVIVTRQPDGSLTRRYQRDGGAA